MEKKVLSKALQIFIGIGIGLLIIWLYSLTFMNDIGIEMNIWWIILLYLLVPIVLLMGAIKLIKNGRYKPLGLSLLVVTVPLIVFLLVIGSCAIIASTFYPM